MELRPDDISEILRIFDESELVELRIELGATKIYLSKTARHGPGLDPETAAGVEAAGSPTVAADAAAAAAAPASHAPLGEPGVEPPQFEDQAVPAEVEREPDGRVDLLSPLLGVFYRRPSPDQPSFVEVGTEVEADDPVCIIDVMKMFTRVPAGVGGRIVEICVTDGVLVEHGQVLMRLEPR